MSNTALYDSDAEGESRVDDDLETASLTDVNSPADGYFEQRNVPEQTYIHNPDHAGTSTKEEEEARLRYGHATSAISHPEPTPLDQPTPLLDAGPAPPDYAAATAGRRAQQEQSFGSDHPLVRNGLVSGQRTPDSRGQVPESMSDERSLQRPVTVTDEERNISERTMSREDEEADEETALLSSRNPRKKTRRSRRSRLLKPCLMLLGVVLLIIVAIVATKLSSGGGKLPGSTDDSDPNDNTPVHRQPPSGPTPKHPSPNGQCTFTSFSETRFFPFSPPSNHDFTLEELIDSTEYLHLFPHGARISGTIEISRAASEEESNKDYDIGVWVNFASTKSFWVESAKFYFEPDRELKIRFPNIGMDSVVDEEACFDIAVAVHVKPGTRLGNLALRTAHLDVVVEEGLFVDELVGGDVLQGGLEVSNQTEMTVMSGDVDVAYWSSRRTVVDTISGDIEGTFALRDLLSLSTKSGHIKVDVDPKEADEEEPLPAEFKAEALSGSIHADFLIDADKSTGTSLPDRDYRVSVDTKSGGISGTYILGRSASFSRISGALDVVVLPYKANLTDATLSTWSASSETKLELLSPYHIDSFELDANRRGHREGIIDSLHSKHHSLSGDIKVKYPQEWEGEFDAEAISGDIKFRGRDVEMWIDTRFPKLMKKVTGRKGNGDSRMVFESTSGSIDVLIGEE